MTLEVGSCSKGGGGPGGGGGGGTSRSMLLPRSAPDLTSGRVMPPDIERQSPSPSSVSPQRSPGAGTNRKSVTIYTRRTPVGIRSPQRHLRSQSVRMVSRRPNRLELPGGGSGAVSAPGIAEFRSRVSSMPLESARFNPRLAVDDEEFYRLRSFSITAKGVVNRGDSLRSRRSRSNNSVAAEPNGSTDLPLGSQQPRVSPANSSRASSRSGRSNGGAAAPRRDSWEEDQDASDDEEEVVKYRVVMIGAPDVGKTALTTQFMTSEYMNAYDASLDDDFGEKSVSVLLDGEESEMIFIDHPSSEMSVENCISTYEPHAYVVVFSITDRGSYQHAEDILSYLWKGDYMRTKAVILVANKTDLVRSRIISTEEGKSLASSHDCKFIETSSGFNHHVDELLVGILSQIRLKAAAAAQSQPGAFEAEEQLRRWGRTHRGGGASSDLASSLDDLDDKEHSEDGDGGVGAGSKRRSRRRTRRRRMTRQKAPSQSYPERSPGRFRRQQPGARTVSFRAKGILNRLCAGNNTKSKSCENLHVL